MEEQWVLESCSGAQLVQCTLEFAGFSLAELATSWSKDNSRGVQGVRGLTHLGPAWHWDLVLNHLRKWCGGKKSGEVCQDWGTFWEQSKHAGPKGHPVLFLSELQSQHEREACFPTIQISLVWIHSLSVGEFGKGCRQQLSLGSPGLGSIKENFLQLW